LISPAFSIKLCAHNFAQNTNSSEILRIRNFLFHNTPRINNMSKGKEKVDDVEEEEDDVEEEGEEQDEGSYEEDDPDVYDDDDAWLDDTTTAKPPPKKYHLHPTFHYTEHLL
jgi:hypothetical protein